MSGVIKITITKNTFDVKDQKIVINMIKKDDTTIEISTDDEDVKDQKKKVKSNIIPWEQLIKEHKEMEDSLPPMNDVQLREWGKMCEAAETRKVTLISTRYQKATTPIFFKCNRDHISCITSGAFKKYTKPGTCKECKKIPSDIIKPMTPKQLMKWEEIKMKAKAKGMILLSTRYNGYNGNIEYQCEKKHIRTMRMDSFLRSPNTNTCKDCFLECIKTDARNVFVKRLSKKGFKLKGKYTGHYNLVECECPFGHICDIKPTNIRNGYIACDKCIEIMRNEEAKEFTRYVIAGECEVKGKYFNRTSMVECKCKHGHKCSTSLYLLRKGTNICRTCRYIKWREEKDLFYNVIVNDRKGEVIGEYIDARTLVKCKCESGHMYNTRFYSIKKGKGRCKDCLGTSPEAIHEKFKRAIAKQRGKIIGEYKNPLTRVDCKCENDHDCSPLPVSVMLGCYMCKKCKDEIFDSKGALNIKKYLEEHKINYKTECRLPILKAVRKYDFLIDDYKIIIEFDGRQHFEFIKKWHRTEEKFDGWQRRDRTKTYCGLLEGYTFIRIHDENYENIESFLDSIFIDENFDEPKLLLDDVDKYEYLYGEDVDDKEFEKSTGKKLDKMINLSSWL
ncbi:MAG: hypothetical protein Solumvirus4_7 [Solumvirus sp.]|uniref:Restriction endonuclease n=1 Tax=Solumvirus sp. TaxID=2487773 RepID=A0A3G5AKE2_9VIRU|nr:MAG: hypothetical protein Solumvirus4_7 [Solumvirus sp.]